MGIKTLLKKFSGSSSTRRSDGRDDEQYASSPHASTSSAAAAAAARQPSVNSRPLDSWVPDQNGPSTSTNGVVNHEFDAAALGPQDPSDPLFGTPYRRLQTLREEGMSQMVVVALDTRNGRKVVVKLLERGPNVSHKVEPEILKHFACRGHPNIVELLDVFVTPKHLAIVMEYAGGGSLRSLIEQRGRVSEDYARCVVRQLLRALRQYHSVGLAKRDLRSNVYLCSDPGSPLFKLGDFAYSKTEQVNSDPKSALGSLVYTAPEEITAPGQSDDHAADMWGVGVLMYAMLCGMYPFGQLSEVYDQRQVQEMLQRIMSVKYDLPDYLSPEAKDLLSNVLVGGVQHRLTVDQFCAHPWVTKGMEPGYWDVDLSLAPTSGAPLTEEQLRGFCREAQCAITSHASADIDRGIDEIMDMDECEEALDELELDMQ